jgi:hypothetical protein
MDAEKEADSIHYCIERLDRLIKDDYHNESYDIFEEKFPDYKWEMRFKPYEKDPNLLEWVDTSTPEERELLNQCYKNAEENQQNDLDELFAQIRLHHEDWWD